MSPYKKVIMLGIMLTIVSVYYIPRIESDVLRNGNTIYVDDVPGSGPGNPETR